MTEGPLLLLLLEVVEMVEMVEVVNVEMLEIGGNEDSVLGPVVGARGVVVVVVVVDGAMVLSGSTTPVRLVVPLTTVLDELMEGVMVRSIDESVAVGQGHVVIVSMTVAVTVAV